MDALTFKSQANNAYVYKVDGAVGQEVVTRQKTTAGLEQHQQLWTKSLKKPGTVGTGQSPRLTMQMKLRTEMNSAAKQEAQSDVLVIDGIIPGDPHDEPDGLSTEKAIS